MSRVTELFLFESMGVQWAYTSGDAPVTHAGVLYEPVTIGRGNAEQTSDINKGDLIVKVSRDNEVGLIHIQYAPDSVTAVTVFQLLDGEYNVFWKGRISGASAGGSEITISCESIFTSLRRPGLRARYQKTCRHAVYARGCTLDPENFALLAQATGAAGASVIVPAAALQPDGWYLGGMLRATDGSLRLITSHVGSQLGLSRPIRFIIDAISTIGYGFNYGNFYGGMGVTIYPGCDRIRATCNIKFANLDNFGGFPWIPSKNPFGGSSIV